MHSMSLKSVTRSLEKSNHESISKGILSSLECKVFNTSRRRLFTKVTSVLSKHNLQTCTNNTKQSPSQPSTYFYHNLTKSRNQQNIGGHWPVGHLTIWFHFFHIEFPSRRDPPGSDRLSRANTGWWSPSRLSFGYGFLSENDRLVQDLTVLHLTTGPI